MSHELAAAGYGFIWPELTFASDGETILVTSRPSTELSTEPVRYLSEFEAHVPASSFEQETDRFLDLVLRRLDSLGQTELHILWSEVLAERADPAQSAVRRFEARLGFEPDEAPEVLVERLVEIASEAGMDAVDEIAPICSGSHPSEVLEQVVELAEKPGVAARIAVPELPIDNRTTPPWQRGHNLANALRQSLSFGTQPLDDGTLGGLLEIGAEHFSVTATRSASPVGLAVRSADRGELKLLFRKRNRPARRFEAARFLADSLCAPPRDRWLPITDAATARQRVQRAFAAELLCPIESLKTYLGNEFPPEAFEDAAEYFGISEVAVKSHLANHHLIPRAFAGSPTVL